MYAINKVRVKITGPVFIFKNNNLTSAAKGDISHGLTEQTLRCGAGIRVRCAVCGMRYAVNDQTFLFYTRLRELK